MMRIRLVLCAMLLWTCVAPASVLAQEAGVLTPPEAVAAALEFADEEDGAEVTVQGEAIGEALVAPDGKRWVNLLGDGTALGVVMSAREADTIPAFGEYRQRGATVRVTGTLQRGCDEHGGDLDLHATSVVVLAGGEEIPHAVHPAKFWLALAALAGALLLWFRYLQLRRRSFLT